MLLDLTDRLADARRILTRPVEQHRSDYIRMCHELRRDARNPMALGDQREQANLLSERLATALAAGRQDDGSTNPD